MLQILALSSHFLFVAFGMAFFLLPSLYSEIYPVLVFVEHHTSVALSSFRPRLPNQALIDTEKNLLPYSLSEEPAILEDMDKKAASYESARPMPDSDGLSHLRMTLEGQLSTRCRDSPNGKEAHHDRPRVSRTHRADIAPARYHPPDY